jgi:antitoxin (DNA-binding transcriptional repressor) of toxin-antitoxin stability system
MAKAEARRRFSEVTTRVGRRGERVKITHYGKTLAILVSKQDLQRLNDCENDSDSRHGTARSRTADRQRRRR